MVGCAFRKIPYFIFERERARVKSSSLVFSFHGYAHSCARALQFHGQLTFASKHKVQNTVITFPLLREG